MTDISHSTPTPTRREPIRSFPTADGRRTLAEWVTFGISCSILVILIGSILFAWAGSRNNPPALSVEAGPVRVLEDQYYVPFTVANTGGESVEAIQVVAKLKVGEDAEEAETGEQSISSLSGGDMEQGSFVFSQDPRDGELVLRVASYRVAGNQNPAGIVEGL